MGAYGNINRAFAGLKAEHYQFDEKVRSGHAVDAIDFGKPVFGYQGDEENLYNYYLDTAKLVFDADFVSLNSIIITVNGVDTDPVVFDTDHDTTAALVVAAIEALEITDNNGNTINPDCILDPADANNRTFYIRGVGVDVTVAEAITLGASQATGTITYQSDQVFRGMARHIAKYTDTKTSGVNVTRYEIDDVVSVVEKGFYYGAINNVTVLSESVCYIDNAGSDKGNFTSASGDSIGALFRSDNFQNSDLSQYLAVIELRGVQKLNAVISW